MSSDTVFIVDDDPDLRTALRDLLEEVELDVEDFGDANSFLEVYDPDRPGCLVIDVRMPGMSGIDLHKTLVERGAVLPVIIITGHADVPMAVEAIKRGALDFVEKPVRPQAMLDLVRRALDVDREQREKDVDRRELERKFGKLTDREREVVDMVCSGLTNKQIAHKRGVSSQAIDASRLRAMEKLGVATVPELVQLALRVSPKA